MKGDTNISAWPLELLFPMINRYNQDISIFCIYHKPEALMIAVRGARVSDNNGNTCGFNYMIYPIVSAMVKLATMFIGQYRF